MKITKSEYKKAKAIVLKTKNDSISFLQRNLGIGYERARVLMQMIKDEQ